MNLIINSNQIGCIAGLVNIQTLHKLNYSFNSQPALHSVYLAKIIEKKPNLNAYIVMLNNNTNALLDFTKNNLNLQIGQKILVQVTKEATKPLKMPKVSANIVLYGNLANYKPFAKAGIISKNLSTEPQNLQQFSNLCIVVTDLYNYNLNNLLISEITQLKNTFNAWQQIKEVGLVYSYNVYKMLLNLNFKHITNIYCNNATDLAEIKQYLLQYNISHIKLQPITSASNNLLLNAINYCNANVIALNQDINLQVYSTDSFNYLDVNFSGNYAINATKEDVIFNVNKQILDLCVKQIVAKNLSGQILIDLLKLVNKGYKNNLLKIAKDLFKKDDVSASVLGFSNLGLLEVSRQKKQENLTALCKSISYNAWLLLNTLQNSNKTNIIVEINQNILTYLNNYASSTIKQLTALKTITFNINNSLTYKII